MSMMGSQQSGPGGSGRDHRRTSRVAGVRGGSQRAGRQLGGVSSHFGGSRAHRGPVGYPSPRLTAAGPSAPSDDEAAATPAT